MGQFVSSISKTNIHPGQLSQRELLSSYLGNESPKTAFAFSTKSHKQIEGKQREMSKSQMKRTKHIMRQVVTYNELWGYKVRSLKVGHQMPH